METNRSTCSPYEVLSRDSDFISENIESIFPVVKESLTYADEKIVLRGLTIAFGPCLNMFTIEGLEDHLFKYSCHSCKGLFVRLLHGIVISEPGRTVTPNYISQQLHSCQEIISILISGFEYLGKFKTIKLTDIRSLLINSSEILQEAYQHCSESQDLYGSHFDSLTDILKSFFKKAQELQSHFLYLLTQVEVSCEQNDVTDFNDILTTVSQSGMALLNLDVKTMADLWKIYTNLLGKYAATLKGLHEISKPISFLCMNVTNNLENIISNKEVNTNTDLKTIKILCFILKLIIKLSEIFIGYLGRAVVPLIELLVTLIKFCHPQLASLNENINMDQFRQLANGVDPLLTALLTDNDFIKELALKQKLMQATCEKKMGFILLSCLILKKLISSQILTREMWFNSVDNIIDWIFNIINCCNFELCCDLKFPGVLIPGKPKRMSDYYEYIFTVLSAFLITSSAKEFIIAERLLFKYLLQTNPWCSLLAVDVWCILARFADAELCYNHMVYLCGSYLQLRNMEIFPQLLFLESLIHRLFPLMSHKHRDLLFELYPLENYPQLWQLFNIQFSSESSGSSLILSRNLTTIRKFIDYLARIDSKTSFIALESALIASSIEYVEKIKVVENLVKLWSFDSSKMILNPIHDRFLKSLCKATNSLISQMSQKNIYLVLHQIKSLLPLVNASCKLHCLEVLNQLSKAIIPEGNLQTGIFHLLSSLFYEYLLSKNVFIKMRSMEIFADFAVVTTHTQLITHSVNKNSTIRNILTHYLQQRHPENEREWDFSDFLKKLKDVKYAHVCKKKYQLCKYDVQGPSSKKVKLDQQELQSSELHKSLSTLQKEAFNIVQLCALLSSDQKKELQLIINALHKILE